MKTNEMISIGIVKKLLNEFLEKQFPDELSKDFRISLVQASEFLLKEIEDRARLANYRLPQDKFSNICYSDHGKVIFEEGTICPACLIMYENYTYLAGLNSGIGRNDDALYYFSRATEVRKNIENKKA